MQSYPRLKDHAFVQQHYEAIIGQACAQLLKAAEAQARAVADTRTVCVDLMAAVCHPLPWRVMQEMTGIPAADVPQAARLVHIMGAFVGMPFDLERMRAAAAARDDMLALITKWVEQDLRPEHADDPVHHLFAYWYHRRVFSSFSELEANIVMFLFAGTHNLENVLAHAVVGTATYIDGLLD